MLAIVFEMGDEPLLKGRHERRGYLGFDSAAPSCDAQASEADHTVSKAANVGDMKVAGPRSARRRPLAIA